MRVGFWKTSRANFFASHQRGLNEEQVKELQALKVGDRLAMWQQEVDGNGPNFSMKKLEETPPAQ